MPLARFQSNRVTSDFLTTAIALAKRCTHQILRKTREASSALTCSFWVPHRPVFTCEEQRIDFMAARDGKITWRQYFAKWGDRSLCL
jgi:hypothetical protein